ncbi:MAG: HAD family hydrolase [Microbacterium sp.]
MPDAARCLIALDIDGTVLREDGSLGQGVLRAVRRVEESGHEVTLATGRRWETTADVVAALGIRPEYVVCSNGAAILVRSDEDASGYARHATETFPLDDVIDLLRAELPEADYVVELADGFRLYTRDLGPWLRERSGRVSVDDLRGREASRVVIVPPEDHSEGFAEVVARAGLNQISYAVGATSWIDLAPHGVDKAHALERVRAWLGVPGERVVVFGDGPNDIEMFQWAAAQGGHAFAMGQATPDVRGASTAVTASIDDGGVPEGLARLGLVAASSPDPARA